MARFEPGELECILTTSTGRAVSRSGLADAVRTAVKRAGARREITFHTFRHYFASMFIRGGLDPKTVQVRMGHASISETFDTYGHLWPDAEDRTRQVVEELGSAIAGTREPRPSPLRHETCGTSPDISQSLADIPRTSGLSDDQRTRSNHW